MKITKENEIKARKLALNKHKRWNKGKKADLWVCGNVKLWDGMEVKCDECGRVCYCDKKVKSVIAKKHTKMCIYCAVKIPEINEEQKAILTKAIENSCDHKWRLLFTSKIGVTNVCDKCHAIWLKPTTLGMEIMYPILEKMK